MDAPDPDDTLAGTPYRLIARLGAGGMGEVFEAEHRALGRRVVVKLLHRHLAARRDLADRMRLEGQALARVDHPHVVAALDIGATWEGRPYLVMERLHGRTLRAELAARGPLPAAEAALMAADALDGLEALHAAGICHRDVKLDNVFLCDAANGRPRTVKLLDLGVAKVVRDDGPAPPLVPTEEGISLGTPRFFSPEQAVGSRVDPRSDVYAMGVVLYALVAGRGPFDDLARVSALLDAHASREPPRPSQFAPVPPALEAAIQKALAKLPEDRFESAAAFAAELRRIAPDLAAAPPIAAPPPPRAPRLVPLFLGVLALSLAVSAAGTVALRVLLR
jgi:serine/threonine-protein kinase